MAVAGSLAVASQLIPVVMALFGKKGKPGSFDRIDRFTPNQMGILNQVLQQGRQPLNLGFNHFNNILGDDQQSFDKFSAPALQYFNRNIIPSILDQVGQTAGLRSSALGQQLGQAATDFGTNLESMRQGLKGDAFARIANMMGLGMMDTTKDRYGPAQSGVRETMFPLLGKSLSDMGMIGANYLKDKKLLELENKLGTQGGTQ